MLRTSEKVRYKVTPKPHDKRKGKTEAAMEPDEPDTEGRRRSEYHPTCKRKDTADGHNHLSKK